MNKKLMITLISVVSIVTVFLGVIFTVWLFNDDVPGTSDWQEIQIKKYGTIKFPSDWIVTNKDEYIYLSNKELENDDCKIYAIGVKEQKKNSEKFKVKSKFLGTVEIEVTADPDDYARCYSNSTIVSLEPSIVNKVESKKYIIEISSLKTNYFYSFIFLDNTVSLNEITKIAKTYSIDQP